MRNLILLLALTVALCARAQTTNIWLGWDHSTSSNVVGYKLWQGDSPLSYRTNWLVQYTNRAPVHNLQFNRLYYWVCTAINSQGQESEFSNEVQWQSTTPAPRPEPPTMLQITDVPEPPPTNVPSCTQQRFSNAGTATGTDVASSTGYLATCFLSDVNYGACRVDLAMQNNAGTYTGNIQVGISSGAMPLVGALSAPVDINSVPLGGTNWISFTTTSSPSIGTNWVILKCNITGTSQLRWFRNAAPSSVGGKTVNGIYRSTDGVTWTLITGTRRFMFKTISQ